ncbi:MAG: DUF4399 domain-containing protein [Hyphomicrobiaceae bacterium]|nr:DUF4399 domain-containing protein [Hyphomicrobiaceae bacterium]
MLRIALVGAVALGLGVGSALADGHRNKAPEGAKVYFIEPADGATVSSPVSVKFGLSGMGVAPAGTEKKNTGHHHLLINQKLEDYNAPIPADEKHIHFGGGQTETKVELKPGTYKLQLILGDLNHIPHDKPVESEAITVTVK